MRGTAPEKRTIRAGGNAFLFLGAADAMIKLGDALPDVTALAAADTARFRVGAHG